MIRLMTGEDYFEVFALWKRISGMGLRTLDDSQEGIARFLRRNPQTNFVCVEEKRIVGTILCGHDGRRGYIYHACVAPEFRGRRLGETLVRTALEALAREKINKAALVCFGDNELGNAFWRAVGWKKREDLNYLDLSLNGENT